jgi:hypothetical protein
MTVRWRKRRSRDKSGDDFLASVPSNQTIFDEAIVVFSHLSAHIRTDARVLAVWDGRLPVISSRTIILASYF